MNKTSTHDQLPENIRRKTFKNVRNYIVQQQAVFVALLNQYATVTISRPAKKSKLTQQRIKVESISFNTNDIIEVNNFVKKRSNQMYQHDLDVGIPRKTAIRRLTQYKILENQHLLSDILFHLGYRFTTYFTVGKNNTPKREIVDEIYLNNKLMYNKLSIISYGNCINEYLCSKLMLDKSVTFEKHDSVLQSFLK